MASVSFLECPTYKMCMYSPAKHSGDSFVKGDPKTFIGLVFEISLSLCPDKPLWVLFRFGLPSFAGFGA